MKTKLFIIILLLIFAIGTNAQKQNTHFLTSKSNIEQNTIKQTNSKDAVLTWCNSVTNSALGSDYGRIMTVVEFDETDLSNAGVLNGQLTNIEFYYINGAITGAVIVFSDDGSGQPGDVLYTQDVTNLLIPDTWVNIQLDASVFLNQKVFIGINYTHIVVEETGFLPASFDDQTATTKNFSSLNNGEAWQHLSWIGNFNIKGYATTPTGTLAHSVTNLLVTSDNTGNKIVDFSWTNPTTNSNNDPLTELTEVNAEIDGTNIYSVAYTGTEGIGATINETNFDLSNFDYGKHKLKVFGVNSSGNGFNAIYDFFIGLDIELSELKLPETGVGIGENINPIVIVKNNGTGTQTFDVTITEGTSYSETITVTDLQAGNSIEITFPIWAAPTLDSYTFTAVTNPVNDFNTTNNNITATTQAFLGCRHILTIIDSWEDEEGGDDWEGSYATLSINGEEIFSNIQIENYLYPINYYHFFAHSGDDIEFVFYADGTYPDECFWELTDGLGEVLFSGKGDEEDVNITETAIAQCPTININKIKSIVEIFPNPTNGVFTIELNEILNTNIEITDISGKIIKQISVNKKKTSIDLSNQTSGIYFIKIMNNEIVRTAKIIVK